MAGLGHAIEVVFELVEVRGPEAAEGLEPRVDFLEGLGAETVEAALRVDGGFDEAGVAQDAEVLGDLGLRHAALALDLAHRLLRGDEQAEYGAAVGLG